MIDQEPAPRSRRGISNIALLVEAVDRLFHALIDPARARRTVAAVLVAYGILWTLYGIFAKWTQDIHSDSAEVVAWSHQLAFGYPKHPPLASLIVRTWFTLFPFEDWAYYLLAVTWATAALWFSWLTFERLLNAEKRVVALALLTLVPFYNFLAFKFDHNAVLTLPWAATTYWFIRSYETRRWQWAALAGAGAAAAMLSKYWSVFLLIGLLFAAISHPHRRGLYFRSATPWITIAVGAGLLVPHIIWLFANDFVPVLLALSRHATDPLNFAAAGHYLVGGMAYAALPTAIVLATARPDRATLIDMIAPKSGQRRFSAVAFWSLLLVPPLVAVVLSAKLAATWTVAVWTLFPIVLISSPLIKFSQAAAVRVLSLVIIFPLLLVSLAPAVTIVNHRIGNNSNVSLLARQVAADWRAVTSHPLRVVGGDTDLAHLLAFYLPPGATSFPITEPQYTPWMDEAKIPPQGIALVCHSHPVDREFCMHSVIENAIREIVGNGAPSSRRVVEITRTYWGVSGRTSRYIVVTVPPT